jgi:hypothetical protein
LWVREFQKRGVVHYHVLCELEVGEERVAQAWGRATDQLHDEAVLRHGVRVDAIKSQTAARRYMGQYVGKEKQKELPKGVDGAGRWWGRSRGLRLAVLEEIIWLDRTDGYRREIQLRIQRVLRRYIEKRFRRRYRGGAFIDYGGMLSGKLALMARELREHWGWSQGLLETLESHGWELILKGKEHEQERRIDGRDLQGDPTDRDEEAGREVGEDHGGAHQEELWPEE